MVDSSQNSKGTAVGRRSNFRSRVATVAQPAPPTRSKLSFLPALPSLHGWKKNPLRLSLAAERHNSEPF